MKKYILITIAGLFTLLSITNCNRKGLDDRELQEYRERGAFLVDTTFRTLSGHLMRAVRDSGVVYAIEYCNLNAYPLVEDLSNEYQADISRRTTRMRNPDNRANGRDKIQLLAYSKQLESGQELSPDLVIQDGNVIYYQPILIQPQCILCHGDKATIGPAYESIAALYPNDKATGYKVGELRGVWRVEFER